jgi:hypothetical protein
VARKHVKPRGGDDLDNAIAMQLHERLSRNDLGVLLVCWKPQDVETMALSTHQLAWLVYYRLLSIRIDKAERMWIETTCLGRDLYRHVRSRACKQRSLKRSA